MANSDIDYGDIPGELIEACIELRCVLFAGPGLSAQAGFPNRFQILDNLIRTDLTLRKADRNELLGMMANPGSFTQSSVIDEVGEVLRSRVPKNELLNALQRLFAGVERRPTEIFRDLKLIPFISALTINWDSLLEETFSDRNPFIITGDPGESIDKAFHPRQFTIAKLHGQLSNPESFRFTAEDYRVALHENQSFARVLVSFVETQTLLFLGMSLSSIDNFFAGIPYRLRPLKKHHYALVVAPKNTRAQQDRFRGRYGLVLLPYALDPSFSGVPRFVAELRQLVVPRMPKVADTKAASDVRLTEVKLNNIGPFSDLQVAFNAPWSIILGNNSAGKSTFLKAIALGLCGDDPEVSGSGALLLRVGQNLGFIELKVGSVIYRTDLIREGDRVRVECKQVTPLLRGDLAVLGFPALRGSMPGSLPSTNFSPGPMKPVVGDLLSLLLGSFDNRLDHLKSWIIYLHVNSTPGAQITRDQAARSIRQRDSLFRVLQGLVPGIRIEYGEVDLQRWQVYLKTPDGKIPIEQISQGIMSLLSWTGTALQRMYDIYPDSEHPETEAALLLVDEIDAHLHPEWQQTIVKLAKTLFPKLQVVASTHSPLLVAGLTAKEVLVAGRDPYTNAAAIRAAPIEFEGMRADQILTSPLFGLVTTRGASVTSDVERYSFLLGKRPLSDEENAECRELKKRLSHLLSSGETEFERVVELTIDKVIADLTTPAKVYKDAGAMSEKARLEVRRQLDELVSHRKKR